MTRRGDGNGAGGELPPDPWAGLAPTPPPPPPSGASPGGGSGRPPSAGAGEDAADGPGRWHPAGHDAPPPSSTGPRGLLGHPAVWVIITAIALLALWTAWMDSPSSLPSSPSPDSVSTAPLEDPTPDRA